MAASLDTLKVDSSKTTYCMPMAHARLVFGDALRYYVLKPIDQEKDAIITLQSVAYETQKNDFTKEVDVANQRTYVATQAGLNEKAEAETWKKQAEVNLKKSKTNRNQRNILVVIWGGTVAFFVYLLAQH